MAQQPPDRPPVDIFGEFGRGAPDLPYRRIARWAFVIVAVILLFAALSAAKNVWTDWLWFDSIGYQEVFSKRLFTRIWLFFAGAGAFLLFFLANAWIAERLARSREPAVLPPETVVLVQGFTRIGIAATAVLFALVFGLTASGQWENMLLFIEGQPFTGSLGELLADPLWGHNPAFYVFDLPFLRFFQTWSLGVILMMILGAVGIYGASMVSQGFHWRFSRGAKLHAGILLGLLAANIASSYWYDINELVLSSRGLDGTLFGANATDANAKLTALRIMMALTSLLAVGAVVSAFFDNPRAPLVGFGVWAVASIVVLMIYPALYHRFEVQPNELARETPYIESNIAMTREAYQLNEIEVRPFAVEGGLEAEELLGNSATVDNIRLWDHRPLRDTYNQIQFLRPYYNFHDVDVDRYEIDGRIQQVMLAGRELAPERLPAEAQSWVAQRLQYTHGYGVAMSPVTTFTSEGRPDFFLKDVPPQGVFEVDRPEIYYGERSTPYVLVNTNTDEFDYPTKQDTPAFTQYAGESGVSIGSFWRKAAFAWRFLDFNILISGEMTPESRILYFREITDRTHRAAPFLEFDDDPYMVVADGKLWWIQDAFTTTNRFPYSQRTGEAFNYIRNSVKVVVDAYNGDVTYYVIEPDDAIIQTYSKIFPSLFKPFEEMPAELQSHIRYPEELFNVQEFMFRTYHLTDARAIFTKEDLWDRPSEIFYDNPQPMEAYYVSMPLPGEVEEEFLLLLPFTPLNKPNMIAWLAARNDGENYGKLVAFTFPKDQQVDGPQQVEARINNDPRISQQFTLWGQQGSQIIRGNLLVIPLEESLIFVEPVYLQASTLNFPELKRVVVAIDDKRPVMEPTLERALLVAFGLAQPTPIGGSIDSIQAPETTPAPEPTPTPRPATAEEADLNKIIEDIERLLEDLRRLREDRN